MRALGDYLQVKCHACVGGTSVREDQRILQNGVHVVVGTPGRVYDMLRRRALRPDYIKIFALDEADEMLSRGFKDQAWAGGGKPHATRPRSPPNLPRSTTSSRCCRPSCRWACSRPPCRRRRAQGCEFWGFAAFRLLTLPYTPPQALEITRKFMSKPVRILVKRDELTLEGIKQCVVTVLRAKCRVVCARG